MRDGPLLGRCDPMWFPCRPVSAGGIVAGAHCSCRSKAASDRAALCRRTHTWRQFRLTTSLAGEYRCHSAPRGGAAGSVLKIIAEIVAASCRLGGGRKCGLAVDANIDAEHRISLRSCRVRSWHFMGRRFYLFCHFNTGAIRVLFIQGRAPEKRDSDGDISKSTRSPPDRAGWYDRGVRRSDGHAARRQAQPRLF